MARRGRSRGWLPAAGAVAVLVGGAALATPPPLEVARAARAGSLPKGVSISPDGARLYVTNYGNADGESVWVYDAADLRRVGSLRVPGVAVESAVAPDGRTLYVSNFRRNSVQFVDLATGRVAREVRAGSHPKLLVVSADGARLFAANWSGRSVTVVDTATGRVVRTLRAGQNPRGLALTRAGRLYVANFNDHSLDVFDGPALDRHRRVEGVCGVPRHLALAPDDSALYVSCLRDSALAVVDTRTDAVVRRVPVGAAPKANDVTPDGRYVVTANYGGSSVSVVDTTDWTVATLDVPAMDHASGIVAARTGPLRFFVTGWYDRHLFAVGLAGGGPGLALSPVERARVLRQRAYHAAHPVE